MEKLDTTGKPEAKSFVAQARAYFGYREGDTLREFKAEVDKLTPKDREELSKMLDEEGYPVKK